MDQLKHLIEVWTGYGQGLAGSIGALAFVFAFIWMIARLDEFFIFVNTWARVEFGSGICARFKAETGWLVTDSCHSVGVSRDHEPDSKCC